MQGRAARQAQGIGRRRLPQSRRVSCFLWGGEEMVRLEGRLQASHVEGPCRSCLATAVRLPLLGGLCRALRSPARLLCYQEYHWKAGQVQDHSDRAGLARRDEDCETMGARER